MVLPVFRNGSSVTTQAIALMFVRPAISHRSSYRTRLASLAGMLNKDGPVSTHSYRPSFALKRYFRTAIFPPSKWHESAHSAQSFPKGTACTKVWFIFPESGRLQKILPDSYPFCRSAARGCRISISSSARFRRHCIHSTACVRSPTSRSCGLRTSALFFRSSTLATTRHFTTNALAFGAGLP